MELANTPRSNRLLDDERSRNDMLKADNVKGIALSRKVFDEVRSWSVVGSVK